MKPTKFPNLIKGDRIFLKSLKREDYIQIFNLINNQRGYIGQYLDWVDNVKTLDDEKKFVSNSIKSQNKLKQFNWCIYEKNTKKFVGFISTDPVNLDLYEKGEYIDWNNDTISFGYFLDKNENGHGYMTETLTLLKDVSIKLGFTRIEINSEIENIKSQKVAERCGFISDKDDFGKMYFETEEKL